MLLKKDFYLIVNKLGLEDHELDFAALVWEKCEKAMQGKTNQSASLLTGKAPVIKVDKVNHRVIRTYAPDDFSREEMMQLRNHLSTSLYALNFHKKNLKQSIQKVWLACNPEEPESADNFEHLNKMKDLLRYLKNKESKLAKIQTKLKKQLSTPA